MAAEEELINGYGARSGNGPASLLYQEDVERGDMQIDLVMTPDKTAGQGFSIPGSPAETGPNNLHSDVYIKYDPRTKNGYALRFWRTTLSASKCMFQLYKIVDGIGSPIDDKQVLSAVLKPNTTMTLRIAGDKFTVDAVDTGKDEPLHLVGTSSPTVSAAPASFGPGEAPTLTAGWTSPIPAIDFVRQGLTGKRAGSLPIGLKAARAWQPPRMIADALGRSFPATERLAPDPNSCVSALRFTTTAETARRYSGMTT